MKKRLFENETPVRRKQLLADNAESKDAYTYFKKYTAEELETVQAYYFKDAVALEKADNELAIAKEVYKQSAKPKKERMADNLRGIRDKGRTVTEDVFLLANFDEGTMDYYNEDGVCVNSRRLTQDEKQLRLMPTGTNN